MKLPIDVSRITIIAISEPEPKLEYGQLVQRYNPQGVPLYSVSVLLSGTGDREDPTTRITFPSTQPPAIKRGDVLAAKALAARSWSMRDNGRERTGIAFEADAIEVSKTR